MLQQREIEFCMCLTHGRMAVSFVSKGKCWKTWDDVCFDLFPFSSDYSVFAWWLEVFVFENCVKD